MCPAELLRPQFSSVVLCLLVSVVVDLLLIVTPIVGFCNCSMFCCALLYVHSSFAIILMGKRELVVLFDLILYVPANNLSVTSGQVLLG